MKDSHKPGSLLGFPILHNHDPKQDIKHLEFGDFHKAYGTVRIKLKAVREDSIIKLKESEG